MYTSSSGATHKGPPSLPYFAATLDPDIHKYPSFYVSYTLPISCLMTRDYKGARHLVEADLTRYFQEVLGYKEYYAAVHELAVSIKSHPSRGFPQQEWVALLTPTAMSFIKSYDKYLQGYIYTRKQTRKFHLSFKQIS